tara:strand:- start:144 stop:260 length:117 start_codon:yes stop_codon:yes gene_type:complete
MKKINKNNIEKIFFIFYYKILDINFITSIEMISGYKKN